MIIYSHDGVSLLGMRGAASPGLDAVLLSSDSKPISSDNDMDCVTGAIEDAAAAGVCGEKQ